METAGELDSVQLRHLMAVFKVEGTTGTVGCYFCPFLLANCRFLAKREMKLSKKEQVHDASVKLLGL